MIIRDVLSTRVSLTSVVSEQLNMP